MVVIFDGFGGGGARSLGGLMVLAVYNARVHRERERERIKYLIEAAMNGVSTIVLRLLFIVKISGQSVRADALVFWMSLVKFLTKNYFNHADVSALGFINLGEC